MNYLILRKKIKRAYETVTGVGLDQAPTYSPNWDKKQIVTAFQIVRPAVRLQYFKDFRFYTQNIKYEFVYEEKE